MRSTRFQTDRPVADKKWGSACKDRGLGIGDDAPFARQGLVEERDYYLAKLPEDFPLKKQSPGIKAINMTTDKDGNKRGNVRFFIVSRYMSGSRFSQSVRGHWDISVRAEIIPRAS